MIADVHFPSLRPRTGDGPPGHKSTRGVEFRTQRLSNRGSRDRGPSLSVSRVVKDLARPLTGGPPPNHRLELPAVRRRGRENRSQEASPSPTCPNDWAGRLLAARSAETKERKQTIDRYVLGHRQRSAVVFPNSRSNSHTIAP
jgi:hypothetical protein